MSVDLFAGIPVSDFAAALPWYERLLGAPPSFLPHDTEAVWSVVEHGYLFIVQRPEKAGHGELAVYVDDLDERVAAIADRGLEPERTETYDEACKVVFVDPDGNEIGFAGASRSS